MICTYCCRSGHSAGSCPLTRKSWAPIALAAMLALAGCGKNPLPPSELLAPSKRLMVPPTDPTPPKAGDDLVRTHLDTVNQCMADNGRFRSLQGYVKTVRGAR